MAHTATVLEYCGVLARSRLLPAVEVNTLHDLWRAESNGSDGDVESFRRFIVGRRYLTEYQAALIQRGHADGFLIGGYVILDRLGRGQSAGVYRAVHTSGQIVALKVLPQSKARNPQVLARFQREGRLLTQLDHPNVVRAFQIGDANGIHYIVMESLDGETLDEVLSRRHNLPPAEASRLVYQALIGLQHLHDRRLIHRDLKPANLMVTPPAGLPDNTLGATLKILDIGLGRELFDEDDDRADRQLTVEGALLGTPDYLAPEQARDARTADIRADMYSMGCVLFHLLAGRPPFVEKNMMAAMVRHATEQPPPVAEFNPHVTPGLASVLARLLAKEPNQRYQTPATAAEALLPFLPRDSVASMPSRVVPAFKQWLDTESQMELPVPQVRPNGPPSGTRLAPLQSRPNTNGPMSSTRLAAPLARPSSSGPMSSTRLGVPAPRPSGPVSSTRLGAPTPAMPRPGFASALGVGAAPPAAAPTTLKPPSARSGAIATPPSRPSPFPEDIDVELVPIEETAPRVVYEAPSRPLWDLDRRDFFMLALGSGGVLGAVAVGVFAARFNKKKISGDNEQQEGGPDYNQ